MSCRLAFVTAIPQNVQQGSGCYVGIRTLANGIRALGGQVEMITPTVRFPVFTVERYIFNQALRFRRKWTCDAMDGFDLDGLALSPRRRHRLPRIANIKGVLADAVPFEHGLTRAGMAMQARWEARHARQADLVITISQYCVVLKGSSASERAHIPSVYCRGSLGFQIYFTGTSLEATRTQTGFSQFLEHLPRLPHR